MMNEPQDKMSADAPAFSDDVRAYNEDGTEIVLTPDMKVRIKTRPEMFYIAEQQVKERQDVSYVPPGWGEKPDPLAAFTTDEIKAAIWKLRESYGDDFYFLKVAQLAELIEEQLQIARSEGN